MKLPKKRYEIIRIGEDRYVIYDNKTESVLSLDAIGYSDSEFAITIESSSIANRIIEKLNIEKERESTNES